MKLKVCCNELLKRMSCMKKLASNQSLVSLTLLMSVFFSSISAVQPDEGIREITVNTVVPKLCTIDSKIDVIDVELGNCCATVNSKLDILLDPGCIPTPITGPTTITAAGSYCLCCDFTASTTGIVIKASNVTLDLNSHTITGGS